jgi:hypothetical protein
VGGWPQAADTGFGWPIAVFYGAEIRIADVEQHVPAAHMA